MGIVSYLVELDDVWVTNFLQNLDLSRDAFHILLVVDLFLLKNFDCHLKDTIITDKYLRLARNAEAVVLVLLLSRQR